MSTERSGSAYADVTDADLLTRHTHGDPDAFGELVRRHRDRLWAVALRTLGDREEAADALQDALVSAYRAAGRFEGRAAVTTWLHRIVVNACLDRARRRAARPAVPLPEDLDQRLPAPAQEDPAVRGETREALLAALATLPAEQRAALVLVDMEGYPVDEAARILDVASGTIKSRCARGRAKLLPLVRHLRESGPPGPAGSPGNPAAGQSVPSADDRPRAGGPTPDTGGTSMEGGGTR
ncbi:RNA polymerase sigma factor SigM [Embleya sp. NPDC020630]|uniref:RNA polymerase sigma factor SigM n=1 Tax=Embleya sp. NPDC020630 TaxID=3363979 RepID=UPI0037908E49